MTEQTPDQQWQTLATQARELARNGTPREVAKGLREIVNQVYQSTKYDRPAGGGLDGRGGNERKSLGLIRDAAENHYYKMLGASS